jgi:hypothetical protein
MARPQVRRRLSRPLLRLWLGSCAGLLGLLWGEARSAGRIEATTSAAVLGGELVIRGQIGHAIHTHGGPPAQLGHVRFVFENHGRQALRVAVSDIEFLRGDHDCEKPPQRVVAHPKSGGILLEDGKMRDSAPQVDLPAGATLSGTVGFVAVPAYYTYCDRFAFRVFFRVGPGGKTRVGVISEVEVSREEPLHRHER